MDNNGFMLLLYSVIDAARELWPNKDREALRAEIENAMEQAFDEWEADQ